MESIGNSFDKFEEFFAKSMLLQGEMNINKITFNRIDWICHGKLDDLITIKNAIVLVLNFTDSENGEKVLRQLNKKIKQLEEEQRFKNLRTCKPLVKFKIPQGWVVYKMTTEDTTKIFGWRGICDECRTHAEEGYYVPVLNHYQCQKCFNRWTGYTKYRPEDKQIEKMGITCVEKNCKNLGLKIE